MLESLHIQTTLGLLCVLLMVYRAHSQRSLTPDGIVAAAVVGTIHALHPFRIIVLLVTFFLCGTKLTHWGSDIKAELLTDNQAAITTEDQPTVKDRSDQKGSSGEAKKGRTAVQVLCNSLPATSLALLHLSFFTDHEPLRFSHHLQDLLIFGVVALYACSAADTFSSEIGILNEDWPILITTFRKVPPGTNGGVSILGLIAALMGGTIIGLTSALVIPTADRTTKFVLLFVGTGSGLFGSLADSVLGATMQKTVYNAQMKKVIEVHGGAAVKRNDAHTDKDKYIVLGYDVLDNNQVNLVSALITVVVTMTAVGLLSYTWQIIF